MFVDATSPTSSPMGELRDFRLIDGMHRLSDARPICRKSCYAVAAQLRQTTQMKVVSIVLSCWLGIMFLGVAVSLLARAALHTQSDRMTGIGFLITVVCLVLLFEKVFPSVYPSSIGHPTKWWKTRTGLEVGAAVTFGIIISILSSRVAARRRCSSMFQGVQEAIGNIGN
jgi:hypothetical protein